MAFAIYTLPGKIGVTWKHFHWRVPLCQTNQLMHCHLFAEGAKVLTRRASERLMADLSAKLNELCLASK